MQPHNESHVKRRNCFKNWRFRIILLLISPVPMALFCFYVPIFDQSRQICSFLILRLMQLSNIATYAAKTELLCVVLLSIILCKFTSYAPFYLLSEMVILFCCCSSIMSSYYTVLLLSKYRVKFQLQVDYHCWPN